MEMLNGWNVVVKKFDVGTRGSKGRESEDLRGPWKFGSDETFAYLLPVVVVIAVYTYMQA